MKSPLGKSDKLILLKVSSWISLYSVIVPFTVRNMTTIPLNSTISMELMTHNCNIAFFPFILTAVLYIPVGVTNFRLRTN